MMERALRGGRGYWTWLGALAVVAAFGVANYLRQLEVGLTLTGMSRDVSWGLYIAQFTFFVGVAASAVMLVMPHYLHSYEKFGKLVVLGESLAVGAVLMCMLFVLADLGQPARVLNVLLHPTPGSMLFWDVFVLNGYLAINVTVFWATQSAERHRLPAPKWVKALVYLSIPWAVSIHTVTAFLYAGLPGRELWLTAITAPRFLASAFASGPALLILLVLLQRRLTRFDPGAAAIGALASIVTYAMIANLFFLGLEMFTAFYSGIPAHGHTLRYLFAGLDGHTQLVPFMWASVALGLVGIALLLVPAWREQQKLVAVACACVFTSAFIDKGMGLVIGGFVPSPLHRVTEYHVTGTELAVSAGIWAIGATIVTVLFKIAGGVREEVEECEGPAAAH
jgi:Ni/Fe-hydrogenase subunit HybB-like protein